MNNLEPMFEKITKQCCSLTQTYSYSPEKKAVAQEQKIDTLRRSFTLPSSSSQLSPPSTQKTDNSSNDNGKSTRPKQQGKSHSFYRRQLPDTCIALSSKKGKELFSSSLLNNGLKSFFLLIEQFTTQSEPAYCGISTLVMILNALSVDPRQTWKGPWRWYTESMLNCCIDLEKVKETGITMNLFLCLARCQGLTVQHKYGSESTLQEFRDAVREACVETTNNNNNDNNNEEDDDLNQGEEERIGKSSSSSSSLQSKFLVISYTRKILNQTGTGHFSPIAAYDEQSDCVLILDTARFKYGPHWVPLSLIFDAMKPSDPETGQSRGYCLISYDALSENSSYVPVSILFRSRKESDYVRWKYISFLREHRQTQALEQEGKQSLSYSDVFEFLGGKDKTSPYIWQMIEPQLLPVNKNEAAIIESLKSLILKLLTKHHNGNKNDVVGCCVSASVSTQQNNNDNTTMGTNNTCDGMTDTCHKARNIQISVEEAVFLVFLASIPVEERRKIIYDDDDNMHNNTDESAKEASSRDNVKPENNEINNSMTTETATTDFMPREQLLAEIDLIRLALQECEKCGSCKITHQCQ